MAVAFSVPHHLPLCIFFLHSTRAGARVSDGALTTPACLPPTHLFPVLRSVPKVSYGRMKALLDLISPQFFRCIPSSMLLKAFQFERSFLATVVAYCLPPMAAMHTILALQYRAYPTQDPAE
eukprot:EG_transcript_46723